MLAPSPSSEDDWASSGPGTASLAGSSTLRRFSALGFGAGRGPGLARRFAAGLSIRLRGSPTGRALRWDTGFAAAPFSFSLTLSKKSRAVTKPPRRSDQGSCRVTALMALPRHCVEASLFADTWEGAAEGEEFFEEFCDASVP